MDDLCIFSDQHDRNVFRLCVREWHGGPDRPDYHFQTNLTLNAAITMVRAGAADDRTNGRILEKAIQAGVNKPRIRVKAGSRKL